MISLVKQIANMDNLMLAWRKIENLFVPGDIWYDPLRLAAFKYRLKENLEQISDRILQGTYRMHELKPVPFPKKKGEDDNEPPIRQSFIIDIADQLVWVAVCNVIGVRLDTKMPAWSYGNRLYLYWWKDSADKWQIGNYRNSTPTLYRNWNQSWPQMKRRITVSLKKMSIIDELDEEEERVYKQEQDTSLEYAKLKYLRPGYFDQFIDSKIDSLFWVGLDLSKFYPHVSIQKVRDIIIRELKVAQDREFIALLSALCSFMIDISEYDGKEEYLKLMGFEHLDDVSYEALPTGLLVAGFLANVFMLDIDRQADAYLDQHHDVIHFRYVDDHVIIGRTPEATKLWVDTYLMILKENGLEINKDKVEPKAVLDNNSGEIAVNLEKLVTRGAIDSFYPTPLMTQTLQKVSLLSKEKLPLLSGSEFNLVFKDLQTMLVTDIPETEIKKATRISFACTMLSRMMRDGQVDYHEVYVARRNLYDAFSENKNLTASRKKMCQDWLFRDGFVLTGEEEASLKKEERDAFNKLRSLIEEGDRKNELLAKSIFGLLIRSLNEVPDKVKVWVRAFLFAINHYPDGIDLLRMQLKKIEKQKALNHLSVLYLESVMDFLSADAILDIIGNLYLNEYSTEKEHERDIRAIRSLIERPSSDEGFSFKGISSMALRKAQALYQSQCADLGLPPIDSFDYPEKEYEYKDGIVLDDTFWEIWKLESIKVQRKEELNVAIKIMNPSRIVPESSFFEGYLFKVLSFLSTYSDANRLLLPEDVDLDKASPELKYSVQMFDVKREYFQIEKLEAPKHKGWISLFDWIGQTNSEMNKLSKKEDAFTRKQLMNKVQYQEIFSVKLMLEIVKRVKTVMGTDKGIWDSRRLHPMNICLNKKDIKDPQWSLVLENNTIGIKLFADDLSGAEVFYETKNTSPYDLPIHFTVCYGLGLNFLHLLTRKTYFPWIMNNPNYGYEWRRELNRLLNKGEVSTINYQIVEACLSTWNRESVFLKQVLEPDLFRNDKSQSMEIYGIDDLESLLNQSLIQMRDNLISVPDRQYRQLIEISVN